MNPLRAGTPRSNPTPQSNLTPGQAGPASAAGLLSVTLQSSRVAGGRTPVTPEQVETFRRYQASQAASALRTKLPSRGSPSALAGNLSEQDLNYVFSRLQEAQTEEDRRVRYAVPRSGDGPVQNMEQAYAEMNKLTERHERGELDDIQYEGRANSLLAEVEALRNADSA